MEKRKKASRSFIGFIALFSWINAAIAAHGGTIFFTVFFTVSGLVYSWAWKEYPHVKERYPNEGWPDD